MEGNVKMGQAIQFAEKIHSLEQEEEEKVEDVVAGHEPKNTEEKDAVSEVPLTEEDLVRTDHNMTVIRHTNPGPDHDANEGFRPVGPLNAILPKTKKECLRFLENTPSTGKHGCIISSKCKPLNGEYAEGTHFKKTSQLNYTSEKRVSSCEDSCTNQIFVWKEIKKDRCNKNEAIVPIHMNHDNIAKVLGVIQRPHSDGLWMELLLECAGISLEDFLKSKFPLPPTEFWEIIDQGLQALKHIHQHKITHHDIKPANFTVKDGLKLSLIDFGSAQLPYEIVQMRDWTPEYLPPECCRFVQAIRDKRDDVACIRQISTQVDMFAFAMVIGYLITRKHLMIGLVAQNFEYPRGEQKKFRDALIKKMAENGAESIDMVMRELQCDERLKELLTAMSCVSVEDRLSAKDTLVRVKDLLQIHMPYLPRKRKPLMTNEEVIMQEEFDGHSTSKLKKKAPPFAVAGMTAPQMFQQGAIMRQSVDMVIVNQPGMCQLYQSMLKWVCNFFTFPK